MLRKMAVAFLLLAALSASALPLRSQTRPRRVTPVHTSPTVTEEAPPRRRQRSLSSVLLEAGVLIGTGRVRAGRRDSCTPSRDIIRDRPNGRF